MHQTEDRVEQAAVVAVSAVAMPVAAAVTIAIIRHGIAAVGCGIAAHRGWVAALMSRAAVRRSRVAIYWGRVAVGRSRLAYRRAANRLAGSAVRRATITVQAAAAGKRRCQHNPRTDVQEQFHFSLLRSRLRRVASASFRRDCIHSAARRHRRRRRMHGRFSGISPQTIRPAANAGTRYGIEWESWTGKEGVAAV